MIEVGTNNHEHTAEQVAGGLVEIVRTCQQKQPQAQIIVIVRLFASLNHGYSFGAIFRAWWKHVFYFMQSNVTKQE